MPLDNRQMDSSNWYCWVIFNVKYKEAPFKGVGHYQIQTLGEGAQKM